MQTEVVSDYFHIDVSLGEKTITIRKDEKIIYTLTRELLEGHMTVLLRVQGKLAFYRVIQSTDIMAENFERLMRSVMLKIDQGLFYLSGGCLVKTTRPKGKAPCRAVYIGATQVALRSHRLIFPQLYVRELGNINLDDTGDTTFIYQQLNALI